MSYFNFDRLKSRIIFLSILTLACSTAFANNTCESLFKSRLSPFEQTVQDVIDNTFEPTENGYAKVIPETLKEKLKPLKAYVNKISNHDLIKWLDIAILNFKFYHRKDVKAEEYEVYEAHVRSSKNLKTSLELLGLKSEENIHSGDIHSWMDTFANAYSTEIFYIIRDNDPHPIRLSSDTYNHLVIYLLHEELVNRLLENPEPIITETGAHIESMEFLISRLKENKKRLSF